LASKPVLLLGNLVSIILTIAGILQALSWTIAGAMILAILSITTLAPSRNSTLSRSNGKKNTNHSFTETRPSRERSSEKQSVRIHQAQSRHEPILDAKTETPRPSAPQVKPELQKSMTPKISLSKTIPTNASPTKLQSKPVVPSLESLGTIPSETRPSPLGPVRPLPPKPDPNVKIIEQGNYQTVDLQLDRGTSVTCEIVASAPVNVYILDDENLTGLDLGEEFWSETGEEDVSKATLSFIAPQTGKWFLVVENTDNKQVSATINVKKNQTKVGLNRSFETKSS
jgi:hypothetical protein